MWFNSVRDCLVVAGEEENVYKYCVCVCVCVCVRARRVINCCCLVEVAVGWVGGGGAWRRERWGGGWGWRKAWMLNAPVLLWKEVSRPVSVLFATISNLLSPATPSVEHQPPPSLHGSWSADGQSSKWWGPVHSALRLDYTKLRPHKITDVSPPSFCFVVLA